MPILDYDPGDSPESPGTLMFYEQGSDPTSGFRVNSKGAILNALSTAWQGAIAATVVANAFVTGDLFDRWRMRADGRMDWGPGDGARDTNLYRPSAGVLKTDNFFNAGSMQSDGDVSMYGTNFTLGTVGGGLRVKEGTNARMGVATLAAGTVVVANTSVTANTRIFLTSQTSGAAPGAVRVSARTAGTSFTISSTSGTDTSVVAYFLMEPAP